MSEAARKKTYVEDISRDLYDEYNPFTYSYKAERGLTPDIVREISKRKNEPSWMTEFRLQSLDIYYQLDVPPWGPNLDELDIDNIITYVKPPQICATAGTISSGRHQEHLRPLGIPRLSMLPRRESVPIRLGGGLPQR